MNAEFVAPSPEWRERILRAVAPLDSGVRNLSIGGYCPGGAARPRPARTAAVLVPVLETPDPQIVLTRRAEHLPMHPGQVSFPGGAAEHDDESAVQTALREAREEIGLPLDRTTPIGFIDRLDTISDYRVLPVVALVRPPVEWTADEREVAEIFTLPLYYVLDRSRYEARSMERAGKTWEVWYLPWRHYTIWGATAAMLLNLAVRYERAGRA